VARQLHAHAWVEALIDRDQLGPNQVVYGQEPAEQYWLRLDPTPPAGRMRESAGGVGQVLDMARNVWDDYVVDMDAERQPIALLGGTANPMNRSYQQFIDRLGIIVGRIRAGELGGGTLASGKLFSWPAAIVSGIIVMLVVLLLRYRPPAWWHRTRRSTRSIGTAEPAIAFYAQTLRQLHRLGLSRESSQTPVEFSRIAEDRLLAADPQPPVQALHFLTQAFYQVRYGSGAPSNGLEPTGDVEHAHSPYSDQNLSRVERALAELTRGIDSIVGQRVNSEL
jgi:hypothetical protein